MAAGIWQGRFQPVHNGHRTMCVQELTKFKNQYIAIVDPNPSVPPMKGFDNFSSINNPFTYFQRMVLWKSVIDDYNSNAAVDAPRLNVTFVPCWHARKYIALENEFLPSRFERQWIVPYDRDNTEINKVDDLRRLNENVCKVECDPRFANITATYIRNHLNSHDVEGMLPACEIELVKKMFAGNMPGTYYLIPFIGDKIDIVTIQKALNLCSSASEDNPSLVFVITVKVSTEGGTEWTNADNLPWWFRPADHSDDNNDITYYSKSIMLNDLMKSFGIKNYYITPIFVRGNNISNLSEYNSAFIPPRENSQWIVNGNITYHYGFSNYLRNINAVRVSVERGLKISDNLLNYFNSEENRDFCLLDNSVSSVEMERLRTNVDSALETVTSWQRRGTRGAEERLDKILAIKTSLEEHRNMSREEFNALYEDVNEILRWIKANQG